MRTAARVVLATAVMTAACSQVLGLDDLKDRGLSSGNPNSVDGSTPDGSMTAGDAGPPPKPGERCKFDLSKFDDGCVFAP